MVAPECAGVGVRRTCRGGRGAVSGALLALAPAAALAAGGAPSPGEACLECGRFVLFLPAADQAPLAPVYQVSVGEALAALAVTAAETDDEEEGAPVPAVREGQEGAARPAGAAPAAPPAPARKATAGWGIPPIPWRGSYRLTANRVQSGSGSSSSGLTHGLTLGGRSFVWQPWFAQVDGSVSLQQGTQAVSGGGTPVSSRSTALDFNTSVLPSSRFPFSLGYNESRNRIQGGADSETVAQRLSLVQRYVPRDNRFNLLGRYDHSVFRDTAGGLTTGDAFNGSVGVPMPGDNPQSLGANVAASRSRTPAAGAESAFTSASANHSIYLEEYVMNVRTEADISDNDTLSASSRNQIQTRQAATTMDWIPSDDYPLRLDGALRVFHVATANQAQETSVTSYTGNLRASYRVDQNWSWQVGGTGLRTQFNIGEGAEQVSVWNGFGSVDWRGDGRHAKLGSYDYSLGYGSSLAGSATKDNRGTDSLATLSASGNQGLSRVLTSGDKTVGSLNFGQSFSVSTNTRNELVRTLGHNAGVSLALASSARGYLTYQLQASDSRSFSTAGQTTYQSLSTSLFGNRLVSAYETLTANLTGGLNRQSISGGDTDAGLRARWVGNASGGATYSHSRFARIPGMLYTVAYTATMRQDQFGGSTGSDSTTYQVDHQLVQRLNWQAGLLGFQLENTFTYSAGYLTGALFLSITRNFGGVL